MLPDIYHIELIGSGSLSIMAKPISGEWMEDEFSGIAQLGINRIVSLLEKHEAIDVGLNTEYELAQKNGMEFLNYPIPDRGLPHSIKDYLDFTKRLYHETAEGIHTVVHCRAGIGRTGMIAAGILLHCGFEPMAAIEHISERRGVAVPDTQEQIDWIVSSFRSLTGRQGMTV